MHPSLISQFSLAGKSAIVTGASRGLGISFARGLAKAGCNLVITARDLERLQRVAQDLEQYGGAVLPVQSRRSPGEGCRGRWSIAPWKNLAGWISW